MRFPGTIDPRTFVLAGSIVCLLSFPAASSNSDFRNALHGAAGDLASALVREGGGDLSVGIARFRSRMADVICEPLSSLLATSLKEGLLDVNRKFGLGISVVAELDPTRTPYLGAGKWYVGPDGSVVVSVTVGSTAGGRYTVSAMKDVSFARDTLPAEARRCLLSFEDVEEEVEVTRTRKVREAPSSLARDMERLNAGTRVWVAARVVSEGSSDWVVVELPDDENMPVGLRRKRGFVRGLAKVAPSARAPVARDRTSTAQPQRSRDASRNSAPVDVTDCDRLAAMPFDHRAVASGVGHIDNPRALNACKTAVQQYPNEPRFAFQLGRAIDSAGRKAEATTWFRKAAEAGYSSAQTALAYAYKDGYGVQKSTDMMLRWMQKGAEGGDALAQFFMAGLFMKGKVVPRDYEQSFMWALRSAEQGVPLSQYLVGIMYEGGIGTAKNRNKAVSWLGKAADAGHPQALSELKKMGAR